MSETHLEKTVPFTTLPVILMSVNDDRKTAVVHIMDRDVTLKMWWSGVN